MTPSLIATKKRTKKDLRSRSYKLRRKRLKSVTTEKKITSYFPVLDEIGQLLRKNKDMEDIIRNFLHKASENKNFDEAINQTNVKNPDCFSLIRRILEMSISHSEINPGGYRYDDTLKKFASYIYMIGGRMTYETLSANLPLPSLSSISRYVLKKGPIIIEGELRVKELKTYLVEKKYPLRIWVSEDATRITENVQYDPRTNQLVGLVLPLDINGMPIKNSFLATSARTIEEHMKNQPAALVYSIMVQPLYENASPFCLCVFTTDNKFTADNVVARWKFIIKKCRGEGIEILGFSSDGDTRLLKGMKMWSQLGVQIEGKKTANASTLTEENSEIPQTWPWYNCDLKVQENFVQDSVHIGVKLRNRLCKSDVKLTVGNKRISIDHLKTLIEKESKDKHKLTISDLDAKDRMNFASVEKICNDSILKLLEKSIPNSEGTCLYLKILNWSIYSYIDPNLTAIERVYKIWYAVFILRIWRSWIMKTKQYTLKNNFITLNCYTCIEINAHHLIKIIIQLRELNREDLFLPHFFSSQTCESFFRQIRSMSSTYSTVVNCSMLEILHRLRRIQLQIDIITQESNKVIFPRFENKKPMIVRNETLSLPTKSEIFKTINSALANAVEDIKHLGISNKDILRDVKCSIINIVQADTKTSDSESEDELIERKNTSETPNSEYSDEDEDNSTLEKVNNFYFLEAYNNFCNIFRT